MLCPERKSRLSLTVTNIMEGWFMGDELKSTLDIVMDKLKTTDKDIRGLDERQKERISEIKREYEAKVAEKKILIKDRQILASELLKLEEKREREIEKIYQESS